MFCKADKGNWRWTYQRLLGHPSSQRTEATCRPPCAQVALPFGNDTVSLGVAQHIAGNILHEIIYVLLAHRGTLKSRVKISGLSLWRPIGWAEQQLDLEASQCPCSQIQAGRGWCFHC